MHVGPVLQGVPLPPGAGASMPLMDADKALRLTSRGSLGRGSLQGGGVWVKAPVVVEEGSRYVEAVQGFPALVGGSGVTGCSFQGKGLEN